MLSKERIEYILSRPCKRGLSTAHVKKDWLKRQGSSKTVENQKRDSISICKRNILGRQINININSITGYLLSIK